MAFEVGKKVVKTAGYFLLDKIVRMVSSILQKYIVDQLCEKRVKAVDFANVSNQIKVSCCCCCSEEVQSRALKGLRTEQSK